MITRKELLTSKEFWLAKFQSTLYEEVEKYLNDNNINKTEFAAKLGVSKGYVSQIVNGDFDHKLSKLIELSLAIGKVPILTLVELDKYLISDRMGNQFTNQTKLNSALHPKKINKNKTITKKRKVLG